MIYMTCQDRDQILVHSRNPLRVLCASQNAIAARQSRAHRSIHWDSFIPNKALGVDYFYHSLLGLYASLYDNSSPYDYIIHVETTSFTSFQAPSLQHVLVTSLRWKHRVAKLGWVGGDQIYFVVKHLQDQHFENGDVRDCQRLLHITYCDLNSTSIPLHSFSIPFPGCQTPSWYQWATEHGPTPLNCSDSPFSRLLPQSCPHWREIE